MKLFDIADAVKYIKAHVDGMPSSIDDEDIEAVIDMIFEYLDNNGALDIDAETEDPLPEEIADYVTQEVALIDSDHEILPFITQIVNAEINYENSLL